ncbi:MAG TPA: hypothetical protein VFU63_05120 [Ktedonobacterales bacterium]|nr:hypothetical protein [Ktedonobacterales bacterium]
MDYVALTDTTELPEAKSEDSTGGISLLSRAKALRIGAFTVDAQTSAIRWRGEMLRLNADQRHALRVMLEHAGQIMSRERLASHLQITADRVDEHMLALRAALEAAGVTWVPRRAEGCGYILWR